MKKIRERSDWEHRNRPSVVYSQGRSGVKKASKIRIYLFFVFGLFLSASFQVEGGTSSAPNALSKPSRKNKISDQELSRTILINRTAAAVLYGSKVSRSREDMSIRRLDPSEIDRFPGDSVVEVVFTSGAREITYRLNPGIEYSFGLNASGELDVFSGKNENSFQDGTVPYVTTPVDVVVDVLDAADVCAEDTVYDLGSGDGRVVIAAAEKYGARGVGIEIVPRLIEESTANAIEAGVAGRVEFRLQDFFTADFSDGTVVITYLMADINDRLRPQLERQLKPGSRIVAHNYPVLGWAYRLVEFRKIKDSEGEKHYLYIYRR